MHESKPPSDALVFFGATGDLAYKKIFPALQSLSRRGRLNVPVIGVAFSGWNRDQLIARAKASCTEYGGLDLAAFEKLSANLRYVDGDYKDPPPKGLYDGLHQHAKASAKGPTVLLNRRQRRIALEALVEKLQALPVEVIAASVDAVHYHLLGRFVDGDVRRAMGQAKGYASRVLGSDGLAGAV